MYGTVGRFRLKPGMEGRLVDLIHTFETKELPGFVAEYYYRLDATANEYLMAVMFENRESYVTLADDPETDSQWYQPFRALLEADPVWDDGEIIYGRSEGHLRQ
jgi:hypothetical protein